MTTGNGGDAGVAQAVVTSLHDGVLTIQLNRPRARNAINREMRRLLRAILLDAGADESVRALVIAGDERAFCSGGDTKEMGNGGEDSSAKLLMSKHIVQLIADMPKPVVAGVGGHAAGAGFSLALACDFIVVDETAVFRSVFIDRALVPDMAGTYWLARQVGLMRAKDIALTGRPVDAQEAYALGIAVRLWPSATFATELAAFAGALAAGPVRALGMTKQLINHAFEKDLGAALDAEALAQAIASSSPEHLAGLVALGGADPRG